jgi:type IV secretory pathway TrbD component
MSNEARVNPMHRSLNKPLTILGVERKLFFLAMVMGAATFNFFGSLLGGLLMFAVLFLLARWTTATDPQLLRILLNASKFKSRYDPAKQVPARGKGISAND